MKPLSDDEFRVRLRALLERTGLSMRGLSVAMGRDQGYLAALLDPTRPSRSRPTPIDLAAASEATGIPLVEWLQYLWDIEPARLAGELQELGVSQSFDKQLDQLAPAQRKLVGDLIDSLVAAKSKRRH